MVKLKEKAPVTATEFAKNFGSYRAEAQREAVPVISHGRMAGYFVSPQDYEFLIQIALEMLRDQPAIEPAKFNALVEPVHPKGNVKAVPGMDTNAHWIHELGPDFSEQLAKTKMDSRHDHLNALLDD